MSAGLSQSDFRALLETKRPESDKDETATKSKKASSVKKRRKPTTYWKNKTQKTEEEGQRYRDRAAERRKGLNPDYDSTVQNLVSVDIEQSKYLGGDLQHTHLVKGLDFALLSKIRSDATHPNAQEQKQRRLSASEALELPGLRDRTLEQRELVVKSIMAQGVLKQLRRTRYTSRPTERFLPGRMQFDFDLDPDSNKELPTITLRSKEDCPVLMSRQNDVVNDTLLSKIGKIISYVKEGLTRPKKKKKKKKKQAELPGDGSITEDPHTLRKDKVSLEPAEDIFAGVGEYVPPGSTSD